MRFGEVLAPERFRLAAGWSAVCLALTLPYSSALNTIFSIATIVFWLLSRNFPEDARRLWAHPVVAPTVLFLVWVVASSLWADTNIENVRDGIFKYRKFILMFACMAIFMKDPIWLRRVLYALFGSLLLLALICLGIGLELPGLPEMTPGQGAILSKSHIAQGYMFGILTAIGLWIAFKKNNKLYLRLMGVIAVLLSVGVTFYLTNGRTGYICVGAALAGGFLFLKIDVKVKVALLTCVFAVLSAAFMTSDRVQERITQVSQEVDQYEQGKWQTSSGFRLDFWKRSLQMWQDSPILGVGVGAWGVNYCKERFDSEQEYQTFSECAREKGMGNPHSDLILVAAQYGMVGLLLWGVLLLQILRSVYLSRDKQNGLGIMLVCLYLLGSAINSFTQDLTEGTLTCMLFSLVCAWGFDTVSRDERLDESIK